MRAAQVFWPILLIAPRYLPAEVPTTKVESIIVSTLSSIQKQLIAMRGTFPQLDQILMSTNTKTGINFRFTYEFGLLSVATYKRSAQFSANGAYVGVLITYPCNPNEIEQMMPYLDMAFPDGTGVRGNFSVHAESTPAGIEFSKQIHSILKTEIDSMAKKLNDLGATGRSSLAPPPPIGSHDNPS